MYKRTDRNKARKNRMVNERKKRKMNQRSKRAHTKNNCKQREREKDTGKRTNKQNND